MAEPETEGTPPKQSKKTGDDASSEKVSAEYLADHAVALTGHQPHVVAAAISESGKEELTGAEATKLAEAFLKKEIDPYEGTPQAEEESE